MAQRSMRAALAHLGFGASLVALTTAFTGTAFAQQTAAGRSRRGRRRRRHGLPRLTCRSHRGEARGCGHLRLDLSGRHRGLPDLNLAESLQRVPGVQIDRDGGEGRTINVRGLSSDFVRVRLNGLEALATTGGRDGRQNRNRAFDFNVFASELFNSIKISKSQSAETEEGSLGATVDLTTARPFDYSGFTMAAGAQASYNDLAQNTDPRATFLVSDRWLDGQLGALFSIAYTKRNTIEEGSSSGRFRIPTADGCASTPPNSRRRCGRQPLLPDHHRPHRARRNGTLTGAAAAAAGQQRRPPAHPALWPHQLRPRAHRLHLLGAVSAVRVHRR